jgi:pimeloyl-ACP methyl ester carboxylesterase
MKVVVDDLAVEYQDEGQGPVMLFLHGWKDDLRTFDLLASDLMKRYHVVRLDLPGFGRSEAPATAWSLDNYVNLVTDFLEKMNIRPDYFVGHSFGGRVVIKGTATKKFHPKKIVLISSAGIAKTNTGRNQLFKGAAKLGKFFTAVPPLSSLRRPLRKKLYQAAGSDYLSAGPLTETYLSIIREDLSGAARHISVPSLLIWGSDDTITPLSDGKFLAQAIPGARLEILDGKSHFVHREAPEQVAELIKEFCV